MHGICESLQADVTPVVVADPVDRPGEVHHALAPEDLARRGDRTEAGRGVQRPAPEAVSDRHGLPRVQPDPHRERQRRRLRGLLEEPILKVDGRPDRLTRGTEDRQGLVSSELDHRPVAGLDVLADDGGEPGGEHRGRLVPPLLGEHGVAADVGDEERADLGPGSLGHGTVADPIVRAITSFVRAVHLTPRAEYRACASKAPARHGLRPDELPPGRWRNAGNRGPAGSTQVTDGLRGPSPRLVPRALVGRAEQEGEIDGYRSQEAAGNHQPDEGRPPRASRARIALAGRRGRDRPGGARRRRGARVHPGRFAARRRSGPVGDATWRA